jgi:hypothetical protein
MRQLLIDQISLTTEAKVVMVEGVNGVKRTRLIGKLQEAEAKNGNGRVYPRTILEREIERYVTERVKINHALGELDHPESSVISLGNTSHNIKRVWWEGDNVMGELELINTPAGNIAKALVEAGIPLGISSRGMGSVRQLGETVEVQGDFELLCWDLVSIPSTPGAYVRPARMNEGLLMEDENYNKYSKINRTITEILCNINGICPLCP